MVERRQSERCESLGWVRSVALGAAASLVVALLGVAVAACSINPIPTPGNDDQGTDPPAFDVLGPSADAGGVAIEDTWVAPEMDAAAPADIAAPEDAPTVPDIVPDVAPPCVVDSDCDDGDPCTLGACVEGTCVQTPAPARICCQQDADCDDGVSCTEDICLGGECIHTRDSSSCCGTRADCNDQDPCTDDLCIAETCVHVRIAAGESCGCTQNVECHDWLDCTDEYCSEGACVYEPAGGDGCCAADADCDDGRDDTLDSCQRWTCHHALVLDCQLDAHCDDADPCTADRCQDGRCVHEASGRCCHTDGQCDDGVAATTDLCNQGLCVHWTAAPPLGCAAADECDDGDPCTDQECVNGLCSLSVLATDGCCTADADCDDGDPCSAGTCAGFGCVLDAVDGPVAQRTWAFGVEEFAEFTVDRAGAGADVGPRWQLSEAGFTSAPSCLYFGELEPAPRLSYAGRAQGTVTLPPVTLPADTPATFSAWLRLDVEPGYSRDQFFIRVIDGAGLVTDVWSKEDIGGGTGYSWEAISADLTPFAGMTVQLSLAFDSIDDVDNDGSGVWIDDLELRWPCSP